jgi:hypothetical protein
MSNPEGGDGVPRRPYPRPENYPNPRPESNGVTLPNAPAWLNVVLRVGVPSAIALWFVFRLTTAMEDRLSRMEQIQAQVIGQLTQHMQNSEVAIAIARQMCLNTAKNDEQMSACIYPR